MRSSLLPWSNGRFAVVRLRRLSTRSCLRSALESVPIKSKSVSRSTLVIHSGKTVPNDSTNPNAGQDPANAGPWAATLEELHLVGADLNAFLESRFNEIEQLAAVLDTEQDEIRAGRERLAESEQLLDSRAQDYEQQFAQLEEARAELEETRAALVRQQVGLEQAAAELAAERDCWNCQRTDIEEAHRQRTIEFDERAKALALDGEKLAADRAWLSSESETLAGRESELMQRLTEVEAQRESLLADMRDREADLEARQQDLNAALATSETRANALAALDGANRANTAVALKQADELAATVAALNEARSLLAQLEANLARASAEQAELRNEYTGAVTALAETRGQLEATRSDLTHAQSELAQTQEKFEEAHALLRDTHELLDRAEREWEANGKEAVASLEFRVAELEKERATLVLQLDESQRQAAMALESADSDAASSQLLIQAEEQIAGLTQQIAAMREQFAGSQAAADRLAHVENENATLHAELEAARAQTSRLAGTAIELADARAELMRRGERIAGLEREQSVVAGAADNEHHARLRDLERERTELEFELEAVRTRVAEQMESTDSEKRRMSEERSQWASELRQLRRALELQSELLGEREAALQMIGGRAAVPSAVAETVVAAAPSTTDPVLDAVREQFQKLQSDRIQRRTSGKKPGRQGVA